MGTDARADIGDAHAGFYPDAVHDLLWLLPQPPVFFIILFARAVMVIVAVRMFGMGWVVLVRYGFGMLSRGRRHRALHRRSRAMTIAFHTSRRQKTKT